MYVNSDDPWSIQKQRNIESIVENLGKLVDKVQNNGGRWTDETRREFIVMAKNQCRDEFSEARSMVKKWASIQTS